MNRMPEIWKIVRLVLYYVLATLVLSVLAYGVFALVFSTDTERRLRMENKMLEKVLSDVSPREERLEDAITFLQHKDNDIYESVFHSDAPGMDPMAGLAVTFASDTIPVGKLAGYTAGKADALLSRVSGIEEAFRRAMIAVRDSADVLPPMLLPVKNLTYPQVGASKGQKINPFYKTYVFHSGLDLMVPRGADVFATADGVVSSTSSRSKSEGKVVEIRHNGGYVTRYTHLESVKVSAGQKVVAGQKIGTVGMTGNSISPHLHYEVHRDGVALDPAGYIFASVSPDDYVNMLFMAANTMQSMD